MHNTLVASRFFGRLSLADSVWLHHCPSPLTSCYWLDRAYFRESWIAIPSLSMAITNDIRPIKPLLPISNYGSWLGGGLWCIVIMMLAGLGWWWYRRRCCRKPEAPPGPVSELSPPLRALARLDQALKLLTQPKAFTIVVCDTIRFYLEERFHLRAPERTTEEFLLELQVSTLLMPKQKQSLSTFLQRCDMVKFARYEPEPVELREIHDAAVRLVQETRRAAEAGDLGKVESLSGDPTDRS